MKEKKGCKWLILIGMFVIFGFFFIDTVSASEGNGKTIRVGYPIQEALTMYDGKGNYSGYTYDYLMEISQYTGWKYEFVDMEGNMNEQASTSIEMLKNGEIDLLGTLYYDDVLVQECSYPGYCYGINYSGLFVPKDSQLTESTLYSGEKVKVGVYKKDLKKSDILDQFAQMNKLNLEQVITDSSEEFNRLMEEGKVEALLSTDVAMAKYKDMRPVAHFSPKPFYFATTKGNTDIVRQLDYAISTINQVNPNFMSQLYNKYFSGSALGGALTEKEQEFIESAGTLNAVIYDNKPPFQYIDASNGKPSGITVEILDYIAENTGISLQYKTVSTYKEYVEALKSGEADISGDAFINYMDSQDTHSTMTLPWHNLPLYMIFKEGVNINKERTFAVPYFLKNVAPKQDDVKYYDTVEQCMQAVKTGKADFAYAGEFCSQYLLNSGLYKELKALSQSDKLSQKLCFGVSNQHELYLLSILNKGISNLPEGMVDEIIYRNTYRQQELTLMTLLKGNKNLFAVVVLFAVAVSLLIFAAIKNRQQKQAAFENQRYNMLSNLANEYFYEYNVLLDELILSDKCADYFSCKAVISKFSKLCAAKKETDKAGIWQLGEYIVACKEGRTELSCQMPDESRKWLQIISSVICSGKDRAYGVGKISDIQDIKSEQISLLHRASRDGLTGIYNISAFKERAGKYLEDLESFMPCALIILDVDDFKNINDSFGHFNGDAVLVEIADLISKVFHDDLAGRLGGDEFVIFAYHVMETEIEERCRMLCDAVLKKTKILLGTSCSISMGVAWAVEGDSYETLYKEADMALYKTKSLDKNGYTIYKEE